MGFSIAHSNLRVAKNGTEDHVIFAARIREFGLVGLRQKHFAEAPATRGITVTGDTLVDSRAAAFASFSAVEGYGRFYKLFGTRGNEPRNIKLFMCQ